jgi:hypothetical protein
MYDRCRRVDLERRTAALLAAFATPQAAFGAVACDPAYAVRRANLHGSFWPIPEWRLGKARLRKAVIADGEPAQRQATISGRSVDRPLWMAPALQV